MVEQIYPAPTHHLNMILNLFVADRIRKINVQIHNFTKPHKGPPFTNSGDYVMNVNPVHDYGKKMVRISAIC